MMPKIILLCGAPRTDCQSVERLFEANRQALLSAGICFPVMGGRRNRDDNIHALIGGVAFEANENQSYLYRVQQVLSDIAAESGAHTIVLSNEDVLGRPFSPRSPVFYARAGEIAERLRLVLDQCDVELRFLVRDYRDFLPAWYFQSLRMGATQSFADFIQSIDMRSVSWRTPVRALRQHFGVDNVGVYDHADFVRDPALFLRAAFPDIVPLLGDRVLRLAVTERPDSTAVAQVYRVWNGVVDRFGPSRTVRRTIQHAGRRYAIGPAERLWPSKGIALPDDIAGELAARYRADLALIHPRAVHAVEPDSLRDAAQ